MLRWEGGAVYLVGEDGPVQRRLVYRYPDVVAVSGLEDDVRRLRPRLRLCEDVLEPHSFPFRRADQVAANLVADTFEGVVLLDRRQRDELVVVQGHRVRDQARHRELPSGRAHSGREYVDIHAVELLCWSHLLGA